MSRDDPGSDAPRYTRPPNDAYEPDSDVEYVRRQLVNNVLTADLEDRITGRGEQHEVLYGARPQDQFFAGALPSQFKYREAKANEESYGNVAKQVSPFKVGVTFRLPRHISDEVELTVRPDAFAFQRQLPTFEEQQSEHNDNTDASVLDQDREVSNESENESDSDSNADGSQGTTDLLRTYKRLDPEWSPMSVTGKEINEQVERDEPLTLDLNLSTLYEKAYAVDRRFRERAEGVSENEASMLTDGVLSSETEFEDHLSTAYDGPELSPLWDARLELDVRADDDDEFLLLTARLINTHGEEYDADDEEYQEQNDPGYEDWRSTFFDVEVAVTVDGAPLKVFESNEIEDKYQYDGRIFAVGENAATEPIFPVHTDENGPNRELYSNQPANDDPVGARTEMVPMYEQSRYLSRNPDDIAAPMHVLAGDEGDVALFDCLEALAAGMEDAVADYRGIKSEMVTGKSNEAATEFDKAVAGFEAEHERVLAGIECLKQDPRALRAFKYMNESFQEMGFDKWRTFQIVFILMTIPDMLKQADEAGSEVSVSWDSEILETQLDVADVVYFPTGGGKTEAYLGLVTFTAFHDRMRGKTHGMTAFTKFPLRFLSLQQLQRIANVLAKAEEIRRREDLGGDEFSVGYLVGSGNTPNTLRAGKYTNNIQKAQEDEEFQKSVKYVTTCPFCGEKEVSIDGDLEQGRIVHQCENPDCEEVKRNGGEPAPLPVYVTDREIYRYTPTFVVSTIDKISIVGMQRRMRAILFGRTSLKCAKHGYSGENRCIADTGILNEAGQCDEDDWEEVEPVDPPSLLIQDELHLLREEFGSFDSHYETLIQQLNRAFSDDTWHTKIVAATATIKGAEQQVEALYMKDTNVFPSPSPRLKQSFYAYAHPTRIQRRMLGALPRTLSRTYAIEKIHEEYARAIQEYRAAPETLYDALTQVSDEYTLEQAELPSDPASLEAVIDDILDDYETQVSYHYSRDNTDLMKRVLRTMINVHLSDDGEPYYPLNGQLMTGQTPLEDVSSVLEILENLDELDSPADAVHMLIATSMISHGVDVDALDFIGFFGLPRNTAEYIQSYSRVGRKWPGTVFLLFDPMRTRDRSYYRHFQYHQEYQDLLVEATPLERWAEYAIKCTMPGVVCSILIQYYDEVLAGKTSIRLYDGEGVQQAVTNGHLKYDEVLSMVRSAYGVDGQSSDGSESSRTGVELYRRQINARFDEMWDALIDPNNLIERQRARNPDTDESNFLTDVLRRGDQRTPMRNLRDIDDQLSIGPDTDTSLIINGYRG
jgi:hypothetical protein